MSVRVVGGIFLLLRWSRGIGHSIWLERTGMGVYWYLGRILLDMDIFHSLWSLFDSYRDLLSAWRTWQCCNGVDSFTVGCNRVVDAGNSVLVGSNFVGILADFFINVGL